MAGLGELGAALQGAQGGRGLEVGGRGRAGAALRGLAGLHGLRLAQRLLGGQTGALAQQLPVGGLRVRQLAPLREDPPLQALDLLLGGLRLVLELGDPLLEAGLVAPARGLLGGQLLLRRLLALTQQHRGRARAHGDRDHQHPEHAGTAGQQRSRQRGEREDRTGERRQRPAQRGGLTVATTRHGQKSSVIVRLMSGEVPKTLLTDGFDHRVRSGTDGSSGSSGSLQTCCSHSAAAITAMPATTANSAVSDCPLRAGEVSQRLIRKTPMPP